MEGNLALRVQQLALVGNNCGAEVEHEVHDEICVGMIVARLSAVCVVQRQLGTAITHKYRRRGRRKTKMSRVGLCD